MNTFLPPATKLGQGYVFTGVCDSVHGGGVPDQVPPQDQVHPLDQVHPPGPGFTPPGPGTPPRDQVPPGPGTPPWNQVHPPPDQYTPWTRYTPPDQVHPRDQVHPPGTRYTPGPGTGTPQDQVPPRDQVHPPGTRYTPPGPGTPPDQVPPWTRYTPPGPGTPPWTRYTPLPPDQVHPPGPGTPPRTRYPPDQVHPPGTRYTPPGPGTPPPGPGRYGLRAGGTHPIGMHSCDEYYFIRVLVLFCTGIQTTVNTSILRTHIGRAACLGPPAWQGPDQVRYCAYPTDQTSTLKVFFSSVDILPWIFIKLSSLILTFLFVTNTSGS